MDAMNASLGMENLSAAQQHEVLAATSSILDNALQAENDRLDFVLNDEDELAKMRKRRMLEMKKEQEQKSKWINQGHGKLGTLGDQKEFFKACEMSERMVAVFTTPNNKWAADLCEHMEYVASKHPETRFVRLDGEKSPFLVEKLGIRVIPSIVLVEKEKVKHTLTGLDEINPSGNYETWHLENCLFRYEMVTHQDIEEKQRADEYDDQESD